MRIDYQKRCPGWLFYLHALKTFKIQLDNALSDLI